MKGGSITKNRRIAVEAIKRQSTLTIVFETGERLVLRGRSVCYGIALAVQADCIRRDKEAARLESPGRNREAKKWLEELV